MTNEEILQKAIEKAVKSGYTPPDLKGIDKERLYFEHDEYNITWSFAIRGDEKKPLIRASVYGTIFSHDFAKAFWGDKAMGDNIEYWQYHLKQMVLEPEPLKYLEKFL